MSVELENDLVLRVELELTRRKSQKKKKAWRSLFSHIVVYLLLNLCIVIIVAERTRVWINGGISDEHMRILSEWQLWVFLITSLGMAFHIGYYYRRHGRKPVVAPHDRRRERYSRRKGKRGDNAPLELEADKPKRVRLTEDGELTESFVEEVYEDEERRYR